MSSDEKEHVRVGRRAMNLLTKRGLWQPAPVNGQTPRGVRFSSGKFQIDGKQGGGATAFDVYYDGKLCMQGRARINWLTEDGSFELFLTEMSDAARNELADLYAAQLPGGFKV
jgi:hypothetical protein